MADPLLEARGLGHRFHNGTWGFRGVDLSLEAGKVVVLAGRNGAGKTIFAKHLAGLLEPTEGSVLFQGEPLASYRESPAARVGYVFQDARLQSVGDTVADDALFGPANLGLSPREARERAEDAILRCGLADRRDSYVHTLSGGESRRLAIAGIAAMRPSVVILDEPFANLDRDGVRSVLAIAADLAASGTALLVVTHELEKILGMADRLELMDGGAIVLKGEPSAVLAEGVERFGLRDPMRPCRSVEDLLWLD